MTDEVPEPTKRLAADRTLHHPPQLVLLLDQVAEVLDVVHAQHVRPHDVCGGVRAQDARGAAVVVADGVPVKRLDLPHHLVNAQRADHVHIVAAVAVVAVIAVVDIIVVVVVAAAVADIGIVVADVAVAVVVEYGGAGCGGGCCVGGVLGDTSS